MSGTRGILNFRGQLGAAKSAPTALNTLRAYWISSGSRCKPDKKSTLSPFCAVKGALSSKGLNE